MDIQCINVRSVKIKATSVADLDIDILALTETWLCSIVDNAAGSRRLQVAHRVTTCSEARWWSGCHLQVRLVPDGYKFHTASRPAQKRGGGVAVIYKSGWFQTATSFTPCIDLLRSAVVEWLSFTSPAGSRRLQFHTVSRPALKRDGGVAVIYKSGLKVETMSNRNKFTHFEHADYCLKWSGAGLPG